MKTKLLLLSIAAAFLGMKKHWRTTALGVAAIIVGIWSAHVTYVPTQTLYFNIVYVWTGQIGLIVAGLIGIFASDHAEK